MTTAVISKQEIRNISEAVTKGGGFEGGKTEKRLSSLIDIPPTLLSMAGIEIPQSYMGIDLTKQIGNTDNRRDCVFMQISESQCGRAIRTDRFKYAIRDLSPTGYTHHSSKIYFEDYLYDLESDPIEKHNLIKNSKYAKERKMLRKMLTEQMLNADEAKPIILPALFVRKK